MRNKVADEVSRTILADEVADEVPRTKLFADELDCGRTRLRTKLTADEVLADEVDCGRSVRGRN